jgi:predicted aldo/keto reductase-like oxidoreductase
MPETLPAMRTRRFGRTELQMPVLTCGGMRFQQSWEDVGWDKIEGDNQANLEATLARALELGMRHIETARGYGSSERQLGRVLRGIDRDAVLLQTKVAPDADPAKFAATFETSLERLGVGGVDLLSVHGINNRETLDWTLSGGCLAEARRFQREGRARFIGFSTHGSPALITEAIETGEFDYVNLHWYFVNHLNWGCVEAAARRDLGVFIISPNDKGGKLYAPPEKVARLCEPLHPMQFNALYCLARPEVQTLSIGAARPSDFDAHVAALADLDRAAEVVAPAERRLRDEMERVLGAEWWATWWRGIPDWTEIPGGVNVLEILRLWSFAKALDLVDWAKMRYNLLGNAGHWFPGVNAAAFDAGAIVAALPECPHAERVPEILREAHAMLVDQPKQRLSKGD